VAIIEPVESLFLKTSTALTLFLLFQLESITMFSVMFFFCMRSVWKYSCSSVKLCTTHMDRSFYSLSWFAHLSFHSYTHVTSSLLLLLLFFSMLSVFLLLQLLLHAVRKLRIVSPPSLNLHVTTLVASGEVELTCALVIVVCGLVVRVPGC
jgi:hypothetical protein